MLNQDKTQLTEKSSERCSLTVCLPHAVTSGYKTLREIALTEISEEEFEKLVSSPDFPEPIEGTRELPLEQRRWHLYKALPPITAACGGTVTYLEHPGTLAPGVVTFRDLA